MERASVPLHGETLGGEGRRVVFLHGLLGSGRNWRFVTGRLSKVCRTYALDLRNHGSSPHTPPFTLDDLASDVEAWMTSPEGSGPAILVGHSLGGKTAMRLACRRPDLVEKLVIVDISTETAPRRWGPIFAAMLSIDLAALKTRKDAEDILEAKGIADWGMRKFLTSGLDVDESGRWRWRANVESLNASADAVVAHVLEDGAHYDGPAFLIRGALSDYAPLADIPAMKRHFPALRVETIPGSGHNVHVEAPHQFLDALLGFINA
jgi:pimeloyl-ACP methyl ester carboxylesterase